MKSSGICTIIFLLTAAVFSGICVAADQGASGGVSHADLAAFVDQAAAYAKDNGKDKAIAEFNNNKSAEFIKGELYIFANDFNGIALAHPYRPDFVGKSQIDLKDVNGVTFIKNMINVAKRGEGSVYYVFANPAHDKKQELKQVYVKKIDDSSYLGSGTYISQAPVNFSQESRDELVALVEQAQKYAIDNGKENALKAFNDKNGQFIKGDLYIFAYDFDGNVLALPYQPELIGKNRMDLQDPNGISFVQDSADIARSGSGFTYYIYANPAENMAEMLKLSYITKVDDTWWLGAGIYAK
ncbi:MAG TPA: cache domain-containing protein [Methanotrichaceae archaeon]|nr:cache domain-containing protein [Methanotrichaceae archaeon]